MSGHLPVLDTISLTRFARSAATTLLVREDGGDAARGTQDDLAATATDGRDCDNCGSDDVQDVDVSDGHGVAVTVMTVCSGCGALL